MKRLFSFLALLALSPILVSAKTSVAYRGEVVNTTHEVAAPITIVLDDGGEKLGGHVEVEPPLNAGRWPLHGRRIGQWLEFVVEQGPGTRTVFRGVVGPQGEIRGTYVFSGDGALSQYGRFAVKQSPAP